MKNIILLFLFVPAIIWIGISSTLSDIKTGKVKNRLIKNGFLYGLIVYLLLFFWTIARKYSVFLAIHAGKIFYLSYNYYFDLMLNVVLALVAGIIVWKLHFWAAGDAKLFVLLSFLVPLSAYSRERMAYFPSFVLLVNTFTICFFYLIFMGIAKLRIKQTRFSLFNKRMKQKITGFFKKIPGKLKLNNILYFLNLILIYAIAFSAISSFKFKINILSFSLSSHILVFLGLFLIFRPLSVLLKKYKLVSLLVFPLLVIVSYFLWKNPSLKFNPFIRIIRFTSGFFIFLFILRTAAGLLSKQVETRKIKLKDLQPNMILGDETINIIKKDKEFLKKEIGTIYLDGLSSEQIEKIRKFLRDKKLKEVDICQTFAFAPFIFAGAIITLILHASLFRTLMQFLHK